MEELFQKYAAAWDAFDPEAIASLYRLPCAIVDSDGVQTYTDKIELLNKFSNNCRDMGNIGYKQAKFSILNQQRLDVGQVAVNIGWLIETETQNIEFRTLYICHKIQQTWFVFSANVYQGSS
ncbi:hypothetical protein [Grimontia sp. NTOU-MAR1]|uniref:hypothetical protein n=1 Tax=Grimontia sp. NTOU-MAR1 TaxID=3111011 RepID=UPI002DB9A4B8|nr:hypothetical protein [Grimontia sp. NTOU-MAR1]WRV99176.1 hypothetical protein VP504_07190 [Grimontia sp. NTOU-MAR1]